MSPTIHTTSDYEARALTDFVRRLRDALPRFFKPGDHAETVTELVATFYYHLADAARILRISEEALWKADLGKWLPRAHLHRALFEPEYYLGVDLINYTRIYAHRCHVFAPATFLPSFGELEPRLLYTPNQTRHALGLTQKRMKFEEAVERRLLPRTHVFGAEKNYFSGADIVSYARANLGASVETRTAPVQLRT